MTTLLFSTLAFLAGIVCSASPWGQRLRARLVAWWDKQREDMRG